MRWPPSRSASGNGPLGTVRECAMGAKCGSGATARPDRAPGQPQRAAPPRRPAVGRQAADRSARSPHGTSAGRRRMVLWLYAAAAVIWAARSGAGAEHSWHFPAAALFADSASTDLHLVDDGRAIELLPGTLVEDDGPAAGYTYGPNVETLSAAKVCRKVLVVDDPRARSATLLVAPGGQLELELNGDRVPLPRPERCGNYWQAYALPPDVLRRGENTFDFRGNGKLWIALEEDFARGSVDRPHHPNRSVRSTDGGRTWHDARLGDTNQLDGEYYVRLHLEQYRPQGVLRTSVVDLGHPPGDVLPRIVRRVRAARIVADAEIPAGTELALRVRSGPDYSPQARSWSAWQALREGGQVPHLAGRYFQIEAVLRTSHPLVSPRLRGLRIAAEVDGEHGWLRGVQLVSSDNPAVVRTSIPFQYEPPDHPRLVQLRRTYELERIAEEVRTEWELIQRLAAWAATRFAAGHLREGYPAWDALDILRPHADGTPVGGFCQQYNLVFLQACESLGLVGRCVSLGPGNAVDRIRGGHEAVEIWSNEHGKWVYVDGQKAWYFVDRQTRVPLSLLELRQRQLAAWHGRMYAPVEVVYLLPEPEVWQGFDGWPPLVELRLIPRSDFLEQASPLPLHQGMRGWFWTGHHVWSDAQLPLPPLYAHWVTRNGNWEWTLNHVHLVLEPGDEPATFRVHLDTHTPHLESLLARVDGGAPQRVESPWTWRLHPGANHLEVVPRNRAGRLGRATHVQLRYPP